MSTLASDPCEEEVSLARYLLVLWRHRLVLLAVALLGGLIAFVVNWYREPVFEATARLMVSPSKIGDVANQAVSVATFISLVNNQTLVLETMNDLGMTRPPRSLSLTQVMERRLRIEVARDANVITVSAQFWEPRLAASFANQLAERAVRLAERLFQQDTVAARDTIKVQVDESRARLFEAERLLEEFKRKAQVDLLTEDTAALLDLRRSLAQLTVDIESERGRVAKITEELGAQERVRNVRRSVDATDVGDTTAPVPRPGDTRTGDARVGDKRGGDKRTGTAQADNVDASTFRLRSELLDPYVNPVHDMLQQQLASSRARLSGLEKQRTEIVRAVGGKDAGVAKLSELYAKQAELTRLDTEAQLARRVYQEVSTRYEQVRVQVAGRSAQLQVIDLALPPERPVGPKVLRNTVMASALAFVVASAAALVLAAVAGEIVEARGAGRSVQHEQGVAE